MSGDKGLTECQNVFAWRIINCGVLVFDKGTHVSSPRFKMKSSTGGTWYFSLKFYPSGTTTSSSKYSSAFLLIETSDPIVRCTFSIEVIGVDGSVLHSKTKTYDVNEENGNGWDDYIEIYEVQSNMLHFPEDILMLQCKLHELSAALTSRFNKLAETALGMDRINFNYFVESLNSLNPMSLTFDCPTSSTYTIYVRKSGDNFTTELRKHQHNLKYPATLKVALFDTNGIEHFSVCRRVLFREDCNLCELKPPEKFKLPKKISFNLVCEFRVLNKTHAIKTESDIWSSFPCLYSPPKRDKLSDIQEQFLSLRMNRKFSDMTLKVFNKTFAVHRFVLSSRSPVFYEMFKTSNANSIIIPGVEPRIFEKFLSYLYAGNVETLDYETAIKLLMLANRFKVISLKDKCLCFLKQILLETRDVSVAPEII